jgi:hypothetical protein
MRSHMFRFLPSLRHAPTIFVVAAVLATLVAMLLAGGAHADYRYIPTSPQDYRY